MEGILGRKVGMTQIYAEDGTAVPVTVVKAGPCLVVQRKTVERDGYAAVQLGLVEGRPAKRVTRPRLGHFAKAGVPPMARTMEFGLAAGEELAPGDEVKASIFEAKQYVDVVGTSKGKGYQGVVKRHGFAGGRATHGSMFHRAPGSIGSSAYPSRVFPGMRAGGRMGGERVTAKNLEVVKVDAEHDLIYLRGAVPGPRNGYVALRRAKRPS
ncbi:MAG TPA: 50S ribosomal protein L3 [Thermoanaerobaculia bacterium]|jgi:large subunit ribosomal protein L3|nr:50S ribosomal protein L3 [Thermoanaerobaculia bacterium]